MRKSLFLPKEIIFLYLFETANWFRLITLTLCVIYYKNFYQDGEDKKEKKYKDKDPAAAWNEEDEETD